MAELQQPETPMPPHYFDRLRNMAARFDRVVLSALVFLAAVAVYDFDAGAEIAVFAGSSLLEIAVFILLSAGLAAYLKASGADAVIARAFQGDAGRAVIMGAIFGALSPFCSCGVVPLIAALLASGVPLAPVMAFWLASPIMDPEMFVLTAAVIGTEFAVVKTLAAIGFGLLGGGAVLLLQGSSALRDPLIGAASCCAVSSVTKARPIAWAFWQDGKRLSHFKTDLWASLFFLGKWLGLAFLIEGAMVFYVPMQDVGLWLAELGPWAVPAAAVIGVPSYLNGYAAIPLTNTLMEHGLQMGAALTFMTAGAVTSIPAAVAVKALVRGPVFGLYIVLALLGSLLVGFLTQAFIGF